MLIDADQEYMAPLSYESQALLNNQDSRICYLSKKTFVRAAALLTTSSAIIAGGAVCIIYNEHLAGYVLILAGIFILCSPCVSLSTTGFCRPLE